MPPITVLYVISWVGSGLRKKPTNRGVATQLNDLIEGFGSRQPRDPIQSKSNKIKSEDIFYVAGRSGGTTDHATSGGLGGTRAYLHAHVELDDLIEIIGGQ